MKRLTVRVENWVLDLIDKLIKKGLFSTRSEFIRFAIRLALKKHERDLIDSSYIKDNSKNSVNAN